MNIFLNETIVPPLQKTDEQNDPDIQKIIQMLDDNLAESQSDVEGDTPIELADDVSKSMLFHTSSFQGGI